MLRTMAVAVAATAAAALVGGCGVAVGSAAPETVPAPDRVVAGPQGRVGQFVVECGFSHYLADDPIVHPGDPGGSHLHQFFGSVEAAVGATVEQLVTGDTTCEQRADTAAYWTPVLVDAEHDPVPTLGSTAYYRAGPDVDPTEVDPYPAGFMMVAGDHTAVEPQPLSVVAWSCGNGSARSTMPPDCTAATSLRMWVTFQDCWDGEHLRSPIVPRPDLHVAYSSAGKCPDSHPVHIPQLQFAVDYEPVPADALDDLALSSGSVLSGHADFWNAWDQDKLRRETAQCIGRDLTCGLTG